MATLCEMIVGFLVPHRCANVAMATCVKCGRHFCENHVTFTPAGLVCTACQQGLAQPVALAQTARDFDASDIALFSTRGNFDDNDTFADLS